MGIRTPDELGNHHRSTYRLGVLITVLGAILGASLYGTAARADDVLVFGAASLTDALGAVAQRYERDHKDHIVASFASSSTLARQIASGAEAEIYASANTQWMDYLEHKQLIRVRSRLNLLGNRLVFIAPAHSKLKTLKIKPGFPLAKLLGDRRLAMGNPEHVPAGIYGKQALTSLGVWQAVAPEVARADDVRAALALVALGEAPLGVVYRTDALADGQVKIVATFPDASHEPIVYPVALTAEAKGPAARAFFGYLTSHAATAIFKRYGFKPLH